MNNKYSNREIESRALELLNSYCEDRSIAFGPPEDIVDIVEFLGYDICPKNDGIYDENILGGLNLEKKLVEFNEKSNKNEGRLNFTLAHEIGHIILHAKDLPPTYSNKLCRTETSMNHQSGNMIEYEADKFAAYLLMPTKNVQFVFNEFRKKPLKLGGNYIFDFFRKSSRRTRAINFVRKIIDAGNFKVSKLAMVNRLISMGMIKGLKYQKNVRR